MTFPIGEMVGNYEILQSLGNGAFGDVYKANQFLLNAERAVKFIKAKQGQRIVDLLDEARNSHAASQLHVVRVFNATLIAHGGEHYVAIEMEYHPEGSIYDIARQDNMSFRNTFAAIRHVLCALSAAHGAGIIHHDIKPANILKAGNNYKLADFGLSYLKGTTSGHKNVSYILHAAPELFTGAQPSETTDLYATGMTLYRLCLPYSEINLELKTLSEWRSKKLDKTFPEHNGLPEYLPNRLKTVIKKATAIDPSKRYSTAEEMMAAVERLSINLDWERSNNGTVWTATKDNKHHVAKLIAKKGKVTCQYKVNKRKPRDWVNIEETPQAAFKRLNKLIKDTLLR
ncbi:MAG: serine/threonine-protein kinase [Alphaproteobacteria bacterium]